jgi:hypothetical protein
MTASPFAMRDDVDKLQLELEMLQDDTVELQNQLDDLNEQYIRAKKECSLARASHSRLKAEFKDKLEEENVKLRDKCLIYFDIIHEYEIMHGIYANRFGAILTSTTLKELYKRGDLKYNGN